MIKPLALEEVLAWKPTLAVERLDSEAMFLLGGRERFVPSGGATLEGAALGDGRRSVRDVLAGVRGRVSEPEALYALGQLVAKRYLIPARADRSAERAVFWHGVGLDGGADEALRAAPVSLELVGEPAPAAWIAEALASAGIRVDARAAVRVVVCDDYLRPELAEINRAALRAGASWFLMKPCGVQPLIGPAFVPGSGPCWDCLAFWIRHNRPVDELVRRHRERS